MFLANTLAPAATQNTNREPTSTGLRPTLSLTGPSRNCPRARPIMPMARPICTMGMEQWKKRVIAGRVGWYMSLTNDPKALSPTR